MQTPAQEITMHYFDNLDSALGEQTFIDLPDGTKVEKHIGRVANIVVIQPDRTIDLSQGPDGEMLDGIETRKRYAPHDDERDTLTEMRVFPQNEEDIRFITDLATLIRNQQA